MKIIRFDAFTESASALSPESFFTQNAQLMADSTLRPHRRPLFVPEEGFWLCEIRPAIKISSLGKGIAREFAPRYYAEFTFVNYMLREPDPEQFFTPGFMLDDSLVHGQWTALPADGTPVVVKGIRDEAIEKPFKLERDFIDRAISALSGNATFKTGDIILLPHTLVRYVPRRESHIQIDLGDTCLLDFKIK